MIIRLVLISIAFIYSCLNGQQEKPVKNISLKESIEIGLQNNPEVRSAEKKISAFSGRFWSGISLPPPEVGFTYEYVPLSNALSKAGEKTMEIRQSFEFPTNYFLKGNKISKEEEIAVQELELTRRKVTAQIKTTFFKLLAKQEILKNAEQNLLLSEEFERKTMLRLKAGEATNIERLTTKVQTSEAKNLIEVAKNELKNLYCEFLYSLGYKKVDSELLYEPADSLVFVEIDLNLNDFYKDAVVKNPTVKIAEISCGISSINKSMAWSSLLPSFNVSYLKQELDGNNNFYGASLGISIPLWFFLDQRGQISEASAYQSMAESELDLVKNNFDLRLKTCFAEYQNNLRQVRLYKNEVLPQIDEIYRIAIKSLDAGELTYLEFIQAKQTYNNSKSNYINILLAYMQSIFSLEELTGYNFYK